MQKGNFFRYTLAPCDTAAAAVTALGFTATSTEVNKLAGVTAGTVTASKALVVGTKKELDFLQLGTSTPTSTALMLGIGSSSSYESTATADKNFVDIRTQTTAATGDCRGAYIRTKFGGAGSGEAVRAYADVTYAGAAAVGGTINGAHISLAVGATSTISGQASAARFTLDYATATRTTDANVSAILLDSNIGANNTVHASNAFIRVTDTGSVALKKLFRLPTVASAGLLAAHVTDAMTHSIRCVDDAGTVFYIMCTTTSSNRTGGA